MVIFLKQIVGGAFQNVTERLQIIKLNAACLIVYDLIKILIAETQLNV